MPRLREKRFRRRDIIEGVEGKMQRYMDKSIGHGGFALLIIQSGKDETAV